MVHLGRCGIGDRRGTAGTLGRHGRNQGWQDCTGADLLEGRLWGSDCCDAGGRRAPGSSADGMVFFFLWLVFRQGAAGTLRRLDRDRGSSGCLIPAFSAVFGCRRSWSGQGGALPTECSIRSGKRGLSCLCRGPDCTKQSNYCTARGEQAGRCGGGVLCSKKAVRSG